MTCRCQTHLLCCICAPLSSATFSLSNSHIIACWGFFFSTCHNLLIADKKTPQKADRYGGVKSGDHNSQSETLCGRNSTTAGVEFSAPSHQVDDQTCWFRRLTICVALAFLSLFIFQETLGGPDSEAEVTNCFPVSALLLAQCTEPIFQWNRDL